MLDRKIWVDRVSPLQAYRAAHANTAIRVFFLTYKDSVEEQRYLSSVRKEKDAFEKLIRERVVRMVERKPRSSSLLSSSKPLLDRLWRFPTKQSIDRGRRSLTCSEWQIADEEESKSRQSLPR